MISLASSSSKSRKQQPNAQKLPDASGPNTKLQQIGASISKNIWLPDNPTTFAFFTLTIAILCGGLFLHINLSAQIAQAQFDTAALEMSYHEIERESAEIVSQIAIATSMFDIYNRATALGYVPLTERDKDFVVASEIVIPQPRFAAAPQQDRSSSSAVAEAFIAADAVANAAAAQNAQSGAITSPADGALFGGANSAEPFRIDEQVATRQNGADSFGRWLTGLWTND